MKRVSHPILRSLLALLLCFAMLLGTTYAWFTDSVSSVNNIIKSGTLDIAMYWRADPADTWKNAEGEGAIFDYDKWEPGYTEVRYIKVVNEGTLAFKYVLNILPTGLVTSLAEVIDVYFFDPAVDIADRAQLGAPVGTLADVISGKVNASGKLEKKGDEVIVAIALKMRETAGNEYQGLSIGDSFTIRLLATQLASESDSFGSDYDTEAGFGSFESSYTAASTVETVDGLVSNPTAISGGEGKITANISEGTKVNGNQLELSVTTMSESGSNVVVSDDRNAMSLNVHVEGIADDNTVPVAIVLKGAMAKGLNLGNHDLYHVENGQTHKMTYIAEGVTPAHNTYSYDPATGDVVLYMASFSEVQMTAAKESIWTGGVDYSWYSPTASRYVISSADQFVAFARIVGGMAKTSSGASIFNRDSFKGKVVKLACNVDLGWAAYGSWNGKTPNDAGRIVDEKGNITDPYFKPIGYYYTNDHNGDKTTGDVYSTLNEFEGTFDGCGYTVKNFYQRTWEIDGDYDGQYYKDGFGLFGFVRNGTVKNLTVENFSSDGEYTPTGVIAARAVNSTFENINIVNCNPRVYNTGNGGIVGIGGSDSDPESYKLVFKNITIDNTNKISALWGSWDVACGGLVGMFLGKGHVYMSDCHVAAQIDVFNDVCGNYQYYWYRYAGMLVGTNDNMVTDNAGYTRPETTKFHAERCTVHFGEWNDYYYCELVVNSLASYTHDHQFSRLTEVKAVNAETMKVTALDGTVTDIPASGRYNYVVVKEGKEGDDAATCYHFVDGKVWNHADAGFETFDLNGDGELNDLKEDRQHYYLPFNQLFTGYGWGVKHVPLGEFEGVTILEKQDAEPVEKFTAKTPDTPISVSCNSEPLTLGRLFSEKADLGVLAVQDASVYVRVDNVKLDESGNYVVSEDDAVSATFTRDAASWEGYTLRFSGTGLVRITIQDYYYCTPAVSAVINVTGCPDGARTFVGRVTTAEDPNGIGYELWACKKCKEAVKIEANHEDGHHFVSGNDGLEHCVCGATAKATSGDTVASHTFANKDDKKNLVFTSYVERVVYTGGKWELSATDITPVEGHNSSIQIALAGSQNYKIKELMQGKWTDQDGVYHAVSKIYMAFDVSYDMVKDNYTHMGESGTLLEKVFLSIRTTRTDASIDHHQQNEIELSAKLENSTLYFVKKTDPDTKEYVALEEGTAYTVNIEIDPETKEYKVTLTAEGKESVTLMTGTLVNDSSYYNTAVFRTNDFSFLNDFKKVAGKDANATVANTIGAIYIDNLTFKCDARNVESESTLTHCDHNWSNAVQLAGEADLYRYTCSVCGCFFTGTVGEGVIVNEFATINFDTLAESTHEKLIVLGGGGFTRIEEKANNNPNETYLVSVEAGGKTNTMLDVTANNHFWIKNNLDVAFADMNSVDFARLFTGADGTGDAVHAVELSFDFLYTGDASFLAGSQGLLSYQNKYDPAIPAAHILVSLGYDQVAKSAILKSNNNTDGKINVEAGKLYTVTLRMLPGSNEYLLFLENEYGEKTCFIQHSVENEGYSNLVSNYLYGNFTQIAFGRPELHEEGFKVYIDNLTVTYETMANMH